MREADEGCCEPLELCCGGKKCPTIRLLSSGENAVIEIFEGDVSFKLDGAQARLVRDWLERAGF